MLKWLKSKKKYAFSVLFSSRIAKNTIFLVKLYDSANSPHDILNARFSFRIFSLRKCSPKSKGFITRPRDDGPPIRAHCKIQNPVSVTRKCRSLIKRWVALWITLLVSHNNLKILNAEHLPRYIFDFVFALKRS